MRVASLVGSGAKIAVATLPFVVVGVLLNAMFPAAFAEEEAELARTFGDRWDRYTRSVKIRWL